jgi:hypothetical protein
MVLIGVVQDAMERTEVARGRRVDLVAAAELEDRMNKTTRREGEKRNKERKKDGGIYLALRFLLANIVRAIRGDSEGGLAVSHSRSRSLSRALRC